MVVVATEVTGETLAMVKTALRFASTHRGGPAMVATILGGRDVEEVLGDAVITGGLFVAVDEHRVIGFALVRGDTIEAVFVDKHFRRKGVATSLVSSIVASTQVALDAYALPGDRGTKSLFESFGWKARLLTMRAE